MIFRKFQNFRDLLDFPLHFLYNRKGKSSKSQNFQNLEKSKFQFFPNRRIFDGFQKKNIFEQEIIPSRALKEQN